MNVSERQKAVAETVARIREKTEDHEITRPVLEDIREELIALAAKKEYFPITDFPPPEADSKRRSCLYRLSEDADHRFALYLNVADGAVSAPPHDHTTWAVIVGIDGQEENRFYTKTPEGVAEAGRHMVEPGTGIAMLPGDIHTIHIEEGRPVMNFHMYGLALEQLHERKFWNSRTLEWKTFPAHTDIREARR
ncbi:MAG: cysteine dioxygenase [Sneathiella sp.]|jgi:predicted metal-dependent enzyme (double-stranded beta helix superfamily)|uniref:cysteine dioxygenase family protein n=1 Tax=Sneathiella sp. TaxID=1964365 RepID=UPI000C49E417|nr:hypothetical protein [Sneathiella sp.]MAL78702.1 cysteine dioxygenase [Sneathiella sp.]